MKTFVTSDLHFDHKNIMTFCPRTRSRFSDVNHMNESMMEEWNDTASPEDLTFILGDIAFCNAEKAIAYLKRLNGDKILIKGNHDRKLLKDPGFRACFKEIHSDLTQTFNAFCLNVQHNFHSQCRWYPHPSKYLIVEIHQKSKAKQILLNPTVN